MFYRLTVTLVLGMCLHQQEPEFSPARQNSERVVNMCSKTFK